MEEKILPDFDFVDEEIEITKQEPDLAEGDNSSDQNSIEDSEQVETTSTSTSEDNSTSSDDTDGEATGLYKFYKDKGFIQNEYEDFDGSYDKLAEILENENNYKLQQTQQAILQAIVNSPNPVTSKILSYVVNKGNDLKPEEFEQFLETAKSVSNDLTEESFNDEKVAEDYLINQLKAQGDDEETIEEIIDLYKDKGQLKKKALTAFKKDNEVKAKLLDKQVKSAEAEKQEQEKNLQEFQKTFVGSIQETGWNKQRQQAVYDELAQGKFKNKVETIYNYPKGLVQLLDFMTYFDESTGTFNLDNYKQAVASKDIKNTKDNLRDYFRGAGKLSGSDKNFGNKIEDLSNIEFAD